MKKKIKLNKVQKIILFFVFAVIPAVSPLALDMRLKSVEYIIGSNKVTDELCFALVTDLHSCYYGENQKNLTDSIASRSPDAVFLVGDIFDDELDNKNSEIFVSVISEKYPTYYVSGNHEWWSGEMYGMFAYLENLGIRVLRGNSDTLSVGNTAVTVCGIDDPEVSEYDSTYMQWEDQLESAAENVTQESFSILLSHRPERTKEYSGSPFDLVLSGHAHGGQWCIPGLMNGLIAPNQGLFPKFAGGLYDLGAQKLIVSRGLARESTLVPRIFNRPEIVFIKVVPQKS